VSTGPMKWLQSDSWEDKPWCWCPDYRASEMGTGIVHKRGQHADSGDCAYAGPQKDTDMREQVRTSFMRVSDGLLDIAMEVKKEQPPLAVIAAKGDGGKVAQLVRLIEELIERDLPDVEPRHYLRRIREIQGG
jgi:Zn-finger protein